MKKVVVFTSPTCGPCRRLKPELVAQSEIRGFELEIVELSADNRDQFRAAGVQAVPVTVLQDDGEELDRFMGGMTASAIEQRLIEWGL